MRFLRFLWLLVAIATLSQTGVSQVAPDGPQTSPFDPQDGDTVVFLGDSITHQSLYTQYIENFFFTRFPSRNIRFHNAGVAGDSLANALVRFDDDVASHKPAYVTVLFGMNDGKYEEFDQTTLTTYQQAMIKLLDRINEIGAQAIVLSPTMFDHGVADARKDDATWRFQKKAISPNYNALMAFFGATAMQESARRKLAYVNLWGPLNELTINGRRDDPSFTLVGDAIHPQASGHVVMSFEILSQLNVQPQSAASLVISKQGNRWVGKGATNIEFDSQHSQLSFDYQPRSLPWVIPDKHATKPLRWKLPSDGSTGYKITHAGHKLSADRLKVIGLPPGKYALTIDDVLVGNYSHAALGTKIELQENPKTPQYQQSMKLAQLNRQRHDDAIRPMRDKWSTMKALQRRYANNPAKAADPVKATQAAIAEFARRSDEMMVNIRQLAQPKSHRWVIRKVN